MNCKCPESSRMRAAGDKESMDFYYDQKGIKVMDSKSELELLEADSYSILFYIRI